MLQFNMTWLKYRYLRSVSGKIPKSFLQFGRLSLKSLANLTSGSLSTRLLFELKIVDALNLRCVIIEHSQVLILMGIENDTWCVAGVAPLTNLIFTMVMTFFIKSLSFVERASRTDEASSKWARFLSLQIVLMIESSDGREDGSISTPKIFRKLNYSFW